MKKESNVINLKGLILAVLLALLAAVIAFAVAGPLALIGIFWGSLLAGAVPAVLCGIIYVLITVKSRKIGTYFIFSLMFALLFILSGSMATGILFIVAGIIGELTMIGGWDKKWRPVVPYVIHWLMYTFASTLQMLFMRDTVLKTYMGLGMDEAAAKTAVDTYAAVYTAPQNMLVWGIVMTAAAVLGYFIGTKVLKKQFMAAGVA